MKRILQSRIPFTISDGIYTGSVGPCCLDLGVFALEIYLVLGGLADDAVGILLNVDLLIRGEDEFLARLLVMVYRAVTHAVGLARPGVGRPLAVERAQASMTNGHCGIGRARRLAIFGCRRDEHGSKETRKHPGEDHAAHGQASADDGDVDLDHGPECRCNVIYESRLA